MLLDVVEQWLRNLGVIAGLATLAAALVAMLQSLRQPTGREERGTSLARLTPVLVLVTILLFRVGPLLWRPLPLYLPAWLRIILLLAGGGLVFGGLALYLWGLRSLGQMSRPSSGPGVRRPDAHRLVTRGPYACIRHPMYLAIMGVGVGSLVLYRTWATLCFAVILLALIVRARREEKMLAQEFGREWEVYASRVPAWLPRVWVKREMR